jgi:hypothetical protein
MLRNPLRSRFLVVAWWLFPIYIVPFIYVGWVDARVLSLWFTGSIMLAAVLARLYRRSAADVLASDSRAPIVYLRNFSQEEILSPANIRFDRVDKRVLLSIASLLLIAAPHVLLLVAGWSIFNHGTGEPWALMLCIVTVLSATLIALFFCFRVLYGQWSLTLEAELAKVFRCVGPMVAIGRPGDWFAPRGAARVYLTDETWQEEVLELIESARIVVLQPAMTEGTWWEVANVVRLRDPRSVLFCNPDNFPRRRPTALTSDAEKAVAMPAALSMDAVFLKLESECGIRIDGKYRKAEFLTFDENWQPIQLPLVFRSWWLWPYVSWRLSRKTFGPLLSYAEQAANEKNACLGNASLSGSTRPLAESTVFERAVGGP